MTITFRIRRRPGAPPLPDMATTDRPEPMDPEKFAEVYGAAPADLEKVADFARSEGLDVVDVDPRRRTVVASATVASASRAFAVDLGKYQTEHETYRGREGPLHLPEDLHDIVEGVFGLDNRRMARRSMALPAAGGGPQPLSPLDVAALYQFPTPLAAPHQTIGLLEFGGGYVAADITTFFAGLGLPTPALTPVAVNGAANDPGVIADYDTEVALDIDVAGAVAQGATLAVYFTTFDEAGWVQAVTTAVYPKTGQPLPSVLSVSWGWPELEPVPGTTFAWTKAAITAVSATFQEASVQGITVLVASGDHGSDCTIGDGRAHTLYPGSDPWVTSCGGTLIADATASPFVESTWQDGDGWATGGGVSAVFNARPPYQSNITITSANDGHVGRVIPDVAGNADNASGYTITAAGNTGAVGGTSAVAPLYAGLAAVLNEIKGKRIGFLNPIVYANPSICRDVADGISNATGGAPGYASTSGYDACTGWGSIIGTALAAKV